MTLGVRDQIWRLISSYELSNEGPVMTLEDINEQLGKLKKHEIKELLKEFPFEMPDLRAKPKVLVEYLRERLLSPKRYLFGNSEQPSGNVDETTIEAPGDREPPKKKARTQENGNTDKSKTPKERVDSILPVMKRRQWLWWRLWGMGKMLIEHIDSDHEEGLRVVQISTNVDAKYKIDPRRTCVVCGKSGCRVVCTICGSCPVGVRHTGTPPTQRLMDVLSSRKGSSLKNRIASAAASDETLQDSYEQVASSPFFCSWDCIYMWHGDSSDDQDNLFERFQQCMHSVSTFGDDDTDSVLTCVNREGNIVAPFGMADTTWDTFRETFRLRVAEILTDSLSHQPTNTSALSVVETLGRAPRNDISTTEEILKRHLLDLKDSGVNTITRDGQTCTADHIVENALALLTHLPNAKESKRKKKEERREKMKQWVDEARKKAEEEENAKKAAEGRDEGEDGDGHEKSQRVDATPSGTSEEI